MRAYGEGITFLPLRALTEHAASLDATAPVVEDIPTAEEVFAHARTLVRHFAAAGPVIIVLDDLHWAVPNFSTWSSTWLLRAAAPS